MSGKDKQGSILLGFMLFLIVFLGGIYLFASNIYGITKLVKLQEQDIKLELLGFSGVSLGLWLIDNNQDDTYLVNLPKYLDVEEKIKRINTSEVFEESTNGYDLKIAFDDDNKWFYVFASTGMSSSGYRRQRLLRCTYSRKPLKIVSVEMN